MSSALALLFLLAALPSDAQKLRKIGELDLYLRGVTATVDPLAPVVPKNTPAGVRIVVRSGDTDLSAADVERLLGAGYKVEGELAGPGLPQTVTLPGALTSTDPLILPLPPLSMAGDYTLTNLRITRNGSTVVDVTPSGVPVTVIDQVLVTSVKTRPLTLAEIQDRGIVLDGSSYLGFEFTLGIKLESKPVEVTFPVVFDQRGVAVPQPLEPPVAPTRDPIPLPTIVPMLLKPDGPGAMPTLKMPDGSTAEVRIPSVLVIPGNVGYLKQHFSAQLFVANGAPGGSGLVVRDVSGTVNLPPGADLVRGTPDDPLTLPDTVHGPQPAELPVRTTGFDGQPGTGDDGPTLPPGEQGMAEFVIRGELEGFHKLDFDVKATLEGLVTGAVTVTGKAAGGVLVRNPYFDMAFTVPAVVRQGEEFTTFVTVNNISQSLANDVKVTLDASRMSGVTLLSDLTQSIATLRPRDSATLQFRFRSNRTGQIVANYLKFDTQNGSTGDLKFTLGVGERGVALSPDTLVLPTAVDRLPSTVVEAAMRVLGQGWSVANAPAGTLPSDVTRTTKTVVTQKALALAEAGLRVDLGQPVADAVRDLIFDFHGGSPLDAGFDQLLRKTEAGRHFATVAGAALQQAMQSAGGAIHYEREAAQIAASGADFATFAIGSGSNGAPVDVTVTDASSRVSATANGAVFGAVFVDGSVPSAMLAPLGPASSAPVLGLVAVPSSGPYELRFTGRANGTTDLSFTVPSNGTFSRAWITGVPIAAGGNYAVTLDANASVLDIDANGDGTYESTAALSRETLSPQGPRLLSATVVGPETIASSSPYGFQLAILFDRFVSTQSATEAARYSIPSNAVLSAKRQLSGRLVFATMANPEGPYIPTTLAVSGLDDPRGVTGPAGSVELDARLRDAGAVVSGRVLNADGTGVATATITYAQNAEVLCAPPLGEYAGLTAVKAGADGRYELRYVRQDACGMPFKIMTVDPSTGGLRSVSSSVRTPGEQIVLDIALYGRGAVTGKVRDLAGRAVINASVTVISETDSQIGGTTLTDGSGDYRVEGVTVGAVRVKAAKGAGVGSASGRIDRAGTAATIDVTIDDGAVAVSGTIRKFENAVTSPVPGLQVVYYAKDGDFVPVGITTTDTNGRYAFTGMPTGEFEVRAALNTRDRGSVRGTGGAGDVLAGRDILIDVGGDGYGTVRGTVRLPGGAPAGGVVVSIEDRGVLSGDDGTFEIPGVVIRPFISQKVLARTRDGFRTGTAFIVLNDPGQVVSGVSVTLSGLAAAEFTVRDAAGNLLPNQEVAILGACENACGCAAATTDSQGRARFEGLPLGSITARATRIAFNSVDQVSATVSLTRDGDTVFGVLTFPGFGVVTGSVLLPDGKPALGADVELTSKVFDEDSCTLVRGVSHRIRTDEAGKFRLTGVPLGSVSLKVTHPFFPTAAGAQGTLARNGDTIDFTLHLTDTISGELSGTVFLPDGTTPAGAGIEVTANGVLPDVVVTTDANGKYRFAKIFPQGSYSLTARDAVTGGVARETVYLRAAQDLVHNLRLKGQGTVQVRVVDGADAPVPTAFVRLQEAEFPNRTFEAAIAASNNGIATFENVFEGRITAEAFDVFSRGGRASSVVPAPGATVELKVALTITGKVRGKFLRPDGVTPVAFGVVKLIAGGRVIGQVTTAGSGDAGAFAFDYVPAGAVRIEAEDPLTARTGFATGTIQSEGQLLELNVLAQGLGTVEGLVTSNGAPQPGALVDVVSGGYKARTSADAAARYRVEGVPQGWVSVTASLDGSFLQGTNSGALQSDGQTLSLDVALRASGELTGQVVRADGTPAPLSVLTVQVGGAGGGTLTATSNEEGRFRFERVPAGLATVTAEVAGSLDRGRASIEVVGGQIVDLPVTLNGVGTVAGKTLDSNGQPAGGDLTLQGTGAFPYSYTLKVGADGQFLLKEVLAGPYTATFRTVAGGFTLHGVAAGTIAHSITNNITVQVQPSGTVKGLVLRPDGTTPAYGATVQVQLDANRGTVSIQTASDGRFSADGVPLGAFTLRIDDPLIGGVAIVPNGSLASNGAIFDAGTITLDNTPVQVVSVEPLDGATGIATATPVVITFSDKLQSTAGISLKKGTGFAGGNAVLSADQLRVTFPGPLPDSSELTVTVSTAATDIFGRHPVQAFTSRFHTVDLSAPSVVSTTPAANAIQVDAASTIDVVFSERLADTTDFNALVTVTGVAGTVSSGPTPESVRFTPAAPLAANVKYSVVVNGAVDVSGNRQTVPHSFTFSTTDTIAPAIALVQPNSAWVKTPRPAIQFNVSDTLSGIDTASGTLTVDGQAVTPNSGPTAITFTPAADLADGNHTVSAAVADRGGNIASASGSFGVDTVAPGAATFTGIADGQTISGTITLNGAATDDRSGVAKIELLRDNALYTTLLAPAFSTTLNTNSLPEGPFSFTARAVDAAGNVGPVSAPITATVDNRPLTVSFTAPAANQRVRDSVVVKASVSEAAARVEFALGAVTFSDSTSPYEATFELAAFPEGAQTITATAHGLAGETASATRAVVIDRTPPAAPDANLINAEPPKDGSSLVFARAGAVEGLATVEINNAARNVQTFVQSAADGSFSVFITGEIDDVLTITAADSVGNRSAATQITVRRTPSLPPSEGSNTLRFEGVLLDRVSPLPSTPVADGQLDAVFTFSIFVGEGATRQLSYIELSYTGGFWTTRTNGWVLGVGTDAAAPLLNAPNGAVSGPVTSGTTFTLFASNLGHFQEGRTYTATAFFTDGSQFVASAHYQPKQDHALVAHSALIKADPPTVIAPAGTTQLTISDIRDIQGNLIPDGSKVALSAENLATEAPYSGRFASASSTITGGVVAANNPSFRVFEVIGGRVQATFNSDPVSPPGLNGAVAVVQMLAADGAGNVIGSKAVATLNINIKHASDVAIVHLDPPALYADGGDRRSTITVEVRTAAGTPVPDGTPYWLVAAHCGGRYSNNACVGSFGGTIIGGEANGAFRKFTTTGGRFTAQYSSNGLSAGAGSSEIANVVVTAAGAGGALTQTTLGISSLYLAGPGSTEVNATPKMQPYVFPLPTPSNVVLHHVHDARGNMVPDGANMILSAANCAGRESNGACVGSAGGLITDGIPSPSGSAWRYSPLLFGETRGTYSISGVQQTNFGSVNTATIMALAARPDGSLLTDRVLGRTQVRIVGSLNALGASEEPSLVGDGALRLTKVRFEHILDAFGNPLPEGTIMVGSAANCAARYPNGACVGSTGGAIVDGDPSPSGSAWRVFPIKDGAVEMNYSSQGLYSVPGEIKTAAVVLLQGHANGALLDDRARSIVPIQITGMTTASASAVPTFHHADGSDRRSVVTVTGFRDSLGNEIVDGRRVAVTVANCGSRWPNGACVGSVGGTIVGGEPSPSGSAYRVFEIANNQIVFEYSTQGLSFFNTEQTAVIQVLSVNSSGALISDRQIATTPVLLVGSTSATVTTAKVDHTANGMDHETLITISDIRDINGALVPDGAKLVLTANGNCTTRYPNSACTASAGGAIRSAGVSPGDGADSPGNSAFKVFTIAGGEVKAIYGSAGIVAAGGEIKEALVQVVSARADGTPQSDRVIGTTKVRLGGVTSTTASGPAALPRANGTGTVTFSGIKDVFGNTVPDGTKVLAAVATNCNFRHTNSACAYSAGGTILNGGDAVAGYRVFTVINGSVSVEYSTQAASTGSTKAAIGLAPSTLAGAPLGDRILIGGYWEINLQ